MTTEGIRNFFFAAFMVLLQAAVLNHIRLFGYAVPMMTVYCLLPTRRSAPQWQTILCGFLVGLATDICSNMPGVGAAAMTLAAFLQTYILQMFLVQDSDEADIPSPRSLGGAKYLAYAAMVTGIYCLAFFLIDAFNFYNMARWSLNAGGSYALTLLLIMAVEHTRRR